MSADRPKGADSDPPSDGETGPDGETGAEFEPGPGGENGPLLDVDEVHTYYGESHILEGVSLEVAEGEVVALVGRNGVGKTTTLRTILQLTPPRSGSVRFRGDELVGLPTHEVAGMGIGWIPEERRIFSQLTVEENVAVALPEGGNRQAATELTFETFPDLEERSGVKAGALSGGQQQMLAIARGLVGGNDMLLIDEPSEGLAPQIVTAVAEAIDDASDRATILLVEQNLPLALDLADRYYVLDRGTVVHTGRTEEADRAQLREYLSA